MFTPVSQLMAESMLAVLALWSVALPLIKAMHTLLRWLVNAHAARMNSLAQRRTRPRGNSELAHMDDWPLCASAGARAVCVLFSC